MLPSTHLTFDEGGWLVTGGDFVQARLWRAPARRWIAHVDMDAFFASVEQHDDPSLRSQPVIVANSPLPLERLRDMARKASSGTHGEFLRGVRGVVASASYEVRQFGVRSAMPLARALVLCPDAVVVPGRFGRYADVARQLRAIWSDFSPVIEPMSLDEAFLDLTGSELREGPIRCVAERLKARVHAETGLTASVGVASNKLVAKIASDLEKPDGLVVVDHGQEAGVLAPLPVRALPGVGPRTAEALARLGISTIGEIVSTPLPLLVRTFGPDHAAGLVARASGIDNSPVEPPGDPKSVSNEITLSEDTNDLPRLRSLIAQLSDKVSWRLRREGFMARGVSIKLRLLPSRRKWTPEGGGFAKPITRQCTLPAPTNGGQEISEAALRLFNDAARSGGLERGEKVVRLLGVGTHALVRVEEAVIRLPSRPGSRQSPAGAGGSEGSPSEKDRTGTVAGADRERRLNSSIDLIRERYGYRAISLGSARNASDPEATQETDDADE